MPCWPGSSLRSARPVLLCLALGCTPAVLTDRQVELRAPPPPAVERGPAWPAPGARLSPAPIVLPSDLVGTTVAIDAGHGAPGNSGATSCRCASEADVVLPIAEALADRLDELGLDVVRLRPPGTSPTYDTRLRTLADRGAAALISVHADVRLPAREWRPEEGCEALVGEGQPGFSVLWSDEGSDALIRGRSGLAQHVAHALSQTGLPAYDGRDYGAYDNTAEGVFVDRHAPGRRIRFLRAPAVPSVIVEVGHLLDPRESERLAEERTQVALAQSMAAGLVAWLKEQG